MNRVIPKKKIYRFELGGTHCRTRTGRAISSNQRDKPSIKLMHVLTAAIITVLVTTSISMLYHLDVLFTCIVIIIGFLFLPVISHDQKVARYQQRRLIDAQIYMEQLLYAFMRQKQLLGSLRDILVLFPEGDMHQIIESAVHMIQYDYEKENCVKQALSGVEESYRNERLITIHQFLYQAEMIGGDYEGVIELLLSDLASWKVRLDHFQSECHRIRRNVVVAIGISLFICMITCYLLPSEMSIDHNLIRMGSTIILIIVLLLIYVRMNRKLSCDWLEHGHCVRQRTFERQYQEFLSYSPEREKVKSILFACIPALVGIYAVYRTCWSVVILSTFLIVFLMNQHAIGHKLAKKRLQREIEKVFPQWLMELSLLLQTDNVQVAISRTLQQASPVLLPELRRFQDALNHNPESVRPYLDFLREFELPQIQSAMKMLYAISAGNGQDGMQQLNELVNRNQQLMIRAESLYDEDALGAMYLLFLAPALVGAMKLICDMTVFLLTFVQGMSA